MEIDSLKGSSNIGEPEFLVVGKIRKPHGINGELRMEVFTDFPERLKPGVTVFVGKSYRPETIVSTRWHKNLLLIKFESCQDREMAGIYRNSFVYVRVADLPDLPEGEFYQHEILGMEVITLEGEKLGVLESILETGANDVYIIKGKDGKEILLPAIDSVIQEISLSRREIIVQVLPGLLP